MQSIECDEVFEVLTRPARDDHDVRHGMIAKHLDSCDECRKLAETFRPAVNLLGRAGNQGDVGESTSIATIMQQVHAAAAETSSRLTAANTTVAAPVNDVAAASASSPGWRLSPLVVIGCLAVGFMAMLLVLSPNANVSGAAMANDLERFDHLLDSGVPSVCLANVGWPHRTAVQQSVTDGGNAIQSDEDEKQDPAGADCCTACHNSRPSEDRPLEGFQPLANSCLICHMDK